MEKRVRAKLEWVQKTGLGEAGPVELAVPRDRLGTLEPQLIKKGQRR